MAVLVGSAGIAAGSADASSIAFIRQGNVWIAGSDGSQPRQLTQDGGTDGSVSYSYVSASKLSASPLLGYRHVGAIGVINPDGSGHRDVQHPRPAAVGPDAVLDPAGDRLAYIWDFFINGFEGYDGATIDLDGTNGTHLGRSSVVDVSFGDATGQSVIWAGFVHNAYGTATGPDCSVGGTEPFGLAVVVPDRDNTQDSHTPTGYFCVPGENVTEPKISADGNAVLATLQASDGSTRIITFPRSAMVSPFNPSATQFTYVTPAGLNASHGDFSPDGTQIVFQGPNNTIYTMPTSGGTPTQVLSNATVPAWSPYSLPSPGPNPGPNPGPTPAVPGSPQLHSLINRGAHKAKFTFSDKGAAKFQCSLVKLKSHGKKKPKPRYSACRSPKTYKGLRSGRYQFFVRGLNSAGRAGKATTKNFKI